MRQTHPKGIERKAKYQYHKCKSRLTVYNSIDRERLTEILSYYVWVYNNLKKIYKVLGSLLIKHNSTSALQFISNMRIVEILL